jgi:hypothetical protein
MTDWSVNRRMYCEASIRGSARCRGRAHDDVRLRRGSAPENSGWTRPAQRGSDETSPAPPNTARRPVSAVSRSVRRRRIARTVVVSLVLD